MRPHSLTRNRRFRLGEILGEGSSGIVFRAHDGELDADIALKALRSVDSARFAQLKAEFRALAGITHPHLVELHELFVDGPECYFTMELIGGLPFVDALRRTGDRVTRVKHAARQLAVGIAAIHSAGKLHRDIKPSNVLLTTDDRVVILDFGVTTSLRTKGFEPEGGPVGTALYMAPEQGRGSPPSSAADWYSFGVILFEALTGRTPFEGSFYEVLERKRATPAPSPRALNDDVPGELDELVRRLLSRDPAERAGLADVLTVLDEGGGRRAAAVFVAPFVGRTAELDQLARARAQATSDGRPIVFRMTGESGIGKTETVRRFVSDMRARPETLVLEGRCHPLESVPYKALDAIVDGLGRHLKTLSRQRLDSLRVEGLEALARIFPGLGRVFGVVGDPELDVGAQEQRSRGFDALSELVARVSEQREVTLWIDDLQWGDVDSVLGLRRLLTARWRMPLLMLVSYRPQEAGTSRALEAAQALFDELPAERVHTANLRPLEPAVSRSLVTALCEAHGVASTDSVDAITAESSGIPFFVGAIVRLRADLDGAAPVDVELAQVVADRLRRLSDRERRLIEVVAVAGGPVERDVVLAASQSGGAGRLELHRLGNGSLVRPTELHDRTAVEIYHDRIREVVLAELPVERKRLTHLRLAETLRRDANVDPEVLLQHYQQAGEDEHTSHFARLAADRANVALAFDRAAELYRLARDLRPDLELHGRLAEALANAGRGVDAARAFGEAADAVSASVPGDARVLEYRRREGEHYLRSGRLAEGTRCLERVAAMTGFSIPRSPRRGLVKAGIRRARLLLKGTDFEPHERSATRESLDRIDALWGASTSLSMLDYAVADAVGVQHLLEALAAGEPSRIVRGLGYEAAFEAIVGGPFFWRRCGRIVECMERMASETSRPYDLAWARMSRGITAWFQARWEEAVACCDEAAELYRRNCKGIAWEIAITDAYALPTLAYLGRLRELARRVPQALQTADARGDLFAANTCRLGQPNLVYLCAHRPADALRAAQDGVAPFPRDTYLIPHYHHLLAVTQAHLYQGDAEAAWRFVEDDWPRLRTSQLLRAQFVRVELWHVRARAALAMAAATRSSQPARSRDLLSIASREASTIRSDSLAVAAPFADAIEAGVLRVQGRTEDAVELLRVAAEGFSRSGMKLMAHAALHQAGILRRGGRGDADRELARSWMTSEGIVSPAAMATMLVPV